MAEEERANVLDYAIGLYQFPAMVWPNTKAFAVTVVSFWAVVSGAKAQTDVWGGGFPSDKVSVGSNWIGGVVPAGISAGSDTLVFNDASDTNMKINQAGVSFAGIEVTDPFAFGNNAKIYGTNTLSIGSGGITQVESGDTTIKTYIATPIALTATQSWTTVNGGYMQVTGAISGSYALNLVGGYNQEFEFDSGSSTFTGGVTVSGADTVLAVGASGTPFGTGPLALGDGVSLEPTTATAIALPNAVSFGDGSGTGHVYIGGNPNADFPLTTSVTFNGNATFNQNTTGSMDSEVDLYANTTVTFNGTLSGGTGGVCIDFGTYNNAPNSIVIINGNFGTGLQRFDVEDNVSVIFDGSSPTSQLASIAANIVDIGTSSSGYLGLGENYIGSVAAFLASPKLSQGGFSGTLGFDNTIGGTSLFTDANIDLTNFTSGSFVGIGSATKAIISGTITPPHGLSDVPTTYPFGGGGGTLTVTSPIVDGSFDGVLHNSLVLSAGNAPLTLILSGTSGNLSYSGGTTINGGALIFDTTLPTTGSISLSGGYMGSTTNSGFLNDDTGATGTYPQTFLNLLNEGSSGVVGFDTLSGLRTISGSIDMSELGSNLFLGTATSITYSGSINPYAGTFKFSGVKGGQVTVTSPSLTGAITNVVIGLPTPMESYGSVYSVILPNANLYGGTGDGSGGTTLNSGYLYVGNGNSIGYGNLTVTGPSDDGTGTTIGLAPYQTNVTLSNNISIPYEGLHLNYIGSPYTLTLGGVISDTELDGSLIVDGPVSLTGNNTFTGPVTVNGTTLTLGSDQALWDASQLNANSGSTINFTSLNPYVSELKLINSTANFTGSGGTTGPEIDSLSMAQGSQINFAANSTPYIGGLDSDDPGSGNSMTLLAGTVLTFDLAADPNFHGTISGPSTSTIVLESGSLNLSGANTGFTGSIMVDSSARLIASNNNAFGPTSGAGTITVNGTLITNIGVSVANPITLNDGGTLAGFGTFSPGTNLNFQNDSLLIPGSTSLVGVTGPSSIPVVGTLAFGGSTSLTFGSNGELFFGITDANGAAGVGYSTVSVSGGLNITATSIAPFDIYIYSFAPGTNATNTTMASNFNSSNPYSWTLVAAAGGITGFNASDFNVNTSGFENPLGIGSFYVSQSGNDLMLNFTPVPEPSTWALMGSGFGALGAAMLLRRRRAPVPAGR